MIWKHPFTLEGLNQGSKNTLVEHLGIRFTAFGDDYIEATMPVDHRTIQPYGLLHGGASVALAETLGSMAAALCVEDRQKLGSVGLEINANHVRSATKGYVTGRTTPVKVGRRIQVWRIEIKEESGKLICVSRITIAVVELPKAD